MAPPDSSLVDDALVTKLLNDAQLKNLMPDGVFWDEANAGSKKFVIVSLIDEADEATFKKGRSIEDSLYLVKAVCLGSTGANIRAAAKRIDALLEDQPLTIEGYELMTMHRESRIRSTEVDEIDPAIRWQHRGGRYRVQVAVS
jgi:hypothetical protein